MGLLFVRESGSTQVVVEDSCELGLESIDNDAFLDLENRRTPQKESPIMRTQISKQGRKRNEESLEDGNSLRSSNSSNVILLPSLNHREESPSHFRSLHPRHVPVFRTNLLCSVTTREPFLDRHPRHTLPNLFQICLGAIPSRSTPIRLHPIKVFAARSRNGTSVFVGPFQISTRIYKSPEE